ncbi:MAG: hypothetical protein P1U34_01470 [Coxiellaceae bacterium]|nr:hypothetical protein [Coxiellaceae bacterium]
MKIDIELRTLFDGTHFDSLILLKLKLQLLRAYIKLTDIPDLLNNLKKHKITAPDSDQKPYVDLIDSLSTIDTNFNREFVIKNFALFKNILKFNTRKDNNLDNLLLCLFAYSIEVEGTLSSNRYLKLKLKHAYQAYEEIAFKNAPIQIDKIIRQFASLLFKSIAGHPTQPKNEDWLDLLQILYEQKDWNTINKLSKLVNTSALNSITETDENRSSSEDEQGYITLPTKILTSDIIEDHIPGGDNPFALFHRSRPRIPPEEDPLKASGASCASPNPLVI